MTSENYFNFNHIHKKVSLNLHVHRQQLNWDKDDKSYLFRIDDDIEITCFRKVNSFDRVLLIERLVGNNSY